MSDAFLTRRGGGGEDLTPELTEQSALIAQIRAMLVGRVTEANATPEDILKGKKAYVGEKLVTGVLEAADGVDFGEVTPTTNNQNIVVNHSLKKVPSVAVLMAKGKLSADAYIALIAHPLDPQGNSTTDDVMIRGNFGYESTNKYVEKTSTTVTFLYNFGAAFSANTTYLWYVMA